jgi:hypothetical protein
VHAVVQHVSQHAMINSNLANHSHIHTGNRTKNKTNSNMFICFVSRSCLGISSTNTSEDGWECFRDSNVVLSIGAIIGIGIGSLVGLAVLVGIIIMFVVILYKRKSAKRLSIQTTQKPMSQISIINASEQQYPSDFYHYQPMDSMNKANSAYLSIYPSIQQVQGQIS